MISRQDALLVTVTSVALSGMTLPLHAQTAAAPASVSGSRLEEVVVTAEKRSARAQATPIAITVVAAKQLQTRHVEDLTDLGALLPSVQMIPVSQTVQVSIRGVGSNFFDPRGQTSVSESIDGLAFARPAQVGNSFFDISRVEVLNGPQGTLYGTNAAAGAVNIVTNQPANHYDGYLEASIGNYLMRGYAGMINIPVTDDLAIRIAGKGVYHNGYIENYYDDAANNAVRATVKWTPTKAFSAAFSYNYSDFNGHGVTPDSYPCDSKPYSNSVSQACAPPGAAGGNYALDGRTKTNLSTYALTLNYDLGFAQVTSITGLMSQAIDAENTPNATFFNIDLFQTSYDLSEEFRIAGPLSGHHQGELGWVVGSYYSNGNGTNFFTGLGLPTNQPKLPENAVAGFGQATYGITNAIRATAGLRYTHDDKGVDDVYGSRAQAAYSHINYKLGLEADVTPSSLAYATVSTGYVSGGADGGSLNLPTAPALVPSIFKPENILSYEIGSKNTFLGGRLRLNGDFYYYIIKNFQSYNPGVLNNGVFGLQIQDIANASTYGGELSGAFAATDDDRFNFSVSLAQGQFGQLTLHTFGLTPFGLAPVLITQPAGFELTNLPGADARLGYAHTWRLPNGASIEAGVDSHISAGYETVPGSDDPFDRQRSFTMTDLHLRYQMARGLSVDGWIKNVEDTVVNTYAENPGYHLYYPLPPRTFGVTVGYSFF